MEDCTVLGGGGVKFLRGFLNNSFRFLLFENRVIFLWNYWLDLALVVLLNNANGIHKRHNYQELVQNAGP